MKMVALNRNMAIENKGGMTAMERIKKKLRRTATSSQEAFLY